MLSACGGGGWCVATALGAGGCLRLFVATSLQPTEMLLTVMMTLMVTIWCAGENGCRWVFVGVCGLVDVDWWHAVCHIHVIIASLIGSPSERQNWASWERVARFVCVFLCVCDRQGN